RRGAYRGPRDLCAARSSEQRACLARVLRGAGGSMTGAKIYLHDPYRHRFAAEGVACEGGARVLSTAAVFSGGRRRTADRGSLSFGGETLEVGEVREDEAGRVWHVVGRDLPIGARVEGAIDWTFRYALMRAHGLMHVVNTIAMQRFNGVITGVQLGADRS